LPNPGFDPWPACQLHLEWGAAGAALAAERGDGIVVVDVLSFSTTLTMAAERGIDAYVYAPAELAAAGGGEAVARRLGVLAATGPRSSAPGQVSLSPASLVAPPPVTGALFSSLNGARVVGAAAAAPFLAAGCLRNATAVAGAAAGWVGAAPGRRVTLVAAGEHWSTVSDRDGFRPCLEDQLGAGAIAAALSRGGLLASPEAAAAASCYAAFELDRFDQVVSARELIAAGFTLDVRLAAEVDGSTAVPVRTGRRCFTASG
jgi:2-phosphosulfolactate phosphatase